MNSLSVTSKIGLKEFDNRDLLFIKENFLDEITSKLLSIRKIKKMK